MTLTERIALHIVCAFLRPLRRVSHLKGIIREFLPSPYQKQQ